MKVWIFLMSIALFAMAQESAKGIVKAFYFGKLSMLTDGVVAKILKKEGERVKKGEAILKLDDRMQRLEVQRRRLLYKSRAKIDSLRSSLTILKKIIAIKEDLYRSTKTVSLNELNQLKIRYIKLKGELESAILAKKREQIEYKISQEVLRHYTLYAPVDGTIVKITPEVGEWVGRSKTVATIVNDESCFIDSDVDVDQLPKLFIGKKVLVQASVGGKVIQKEGIVRFISSVVDSSSSLIRVKVYVDNKDHSLLPGLAATILF